MVVGKYYYKGEYFVSESDYGNITQLANERGREIIKFQEKQKNIRMAV